MDTNFIQSTVLDITPRNWTALLDAIYVGIHHSKVARNPRRALLVLSDGADNHSRYTESEIKMLVRESDVGIYGLGLVGGALLNRPDRLLKHLASQTGGLYFPVAKLSDLPESVARISRLIAAYLTHDLERGRERTVRELVSEFRGLSGSLKQKAVLAATGLQRATLARLCDGSAIDRSTVAGLLDAMIAHTRPVKPEALGIIGKGHLHGRLEQAGCEMASFQYKQVRSTDPRLPWVIEAGFAWCPHQTSRRLITGVNWSPGILNPFRALGPYRQSLDTVLSQQRADRDEPVIVLLHLSCPRVEYTDRGKSAVVVAR
jgi:hypothetical protein